MVKRLRIREKESIAYPYKVKNLEIAGKLGSGFSIIPKPVDPIENIAPKT